MNTTNPKKVLAKDIMCHKVVSVRPEASIFDVTKLISEHNFDGLPVMDKDGKLLGIITEYDLITKTSSINTSLLAQILSEVKATKEMQDSIKASTKEVSALIASDIMNAEPLTVKEDEPFDNILKAFVAHHKVNPIPVVNSENKVVGIISRFDVLRPLNLLGFGVKK